MRCGREVSEGIENLNNLAPELSRNLEAVISEMPHRNVVVRAADKNRAQVPAQRVHIQLDRALFEIDSNSRVLAVDAHGPVSASMSDHEVHLKLPTASRRPASRQE